ncbi:MAG: CBS domain-containing protein [Bacteriovoracaceae bacterium]|nr:CBS domain-containing protein [Bacteriovoracaceae bacterium]
MSFLVSFNGQYSPYVYKTEGSPSVRIQTLTPMKDFETELIQAQETAEGDGKVVQKNAGVGAYQKQVKQFEAKKKRIHAKDIMSSPLHTIQKHQSIAEATEIMSRMGFRHLPVLEGVDHLVGMISQRDILCAKTARGVSEIMNPQIIVALDSARIQDTAHLMLDEKINALPVVNIHHKLVGIITLSDILKFVIHMDEL